MSDWVNVFSCQHHCLVVADPDIFILWPIRGDQALRQVDPSNFNIKKSQAILRTRVEYGL